MKPDVYEVTYGVTDHLAFTIEEFIEVAYCLKICRAIFDVA